ncbi:peptidase S8 [Corallococcus macrosporus DSM 14697]|uniref:Peptidase S8 n=2 Tax=Corallococcus macrosporus TaxID=35 RepID=A0A250K078_9BACT|nr:peptidase S8 [Corallococcus macrosporus DSM 14697]
MPMGGKKNGNGSGMMPSPGAAETTGRYIVLLPDVEGAQAAHSLDKVAGVKARVLNGGPPEAQGGIESGSIVFPAIGAAVVEMDPDQLQALGVAEQKGELPTLAVEPERVVRAFPGPDAGVTGLNGGGSAGLDLSGSLAGAPVWPHPAERLALEGPPRMGLPMNLAPTQELSAAYLRGYRDSVVQLVDRLLGDGGVSVERYAPAALRAMDDLEATWGLHATRVPASQYTGRGIKVAVLDTGFGPHADFANRNFLTASFVPGQEVTDRNGHGTHCIGTACGFRPVTRGPRYGIACEADIIVGKVLGDDGFGTDGGILAGINWAVAQGANIISLSLGASVLPGQSFSTVYDGVAQRALLRGTLMIAAAGNASRRPGDIKPVEHPANCPHILAVAAVDMNLQVAWFSCGEVNPNGGEVNIAAPGVDVFSSYPLPPHYKRLSGTSMATPHVAGIAALFAQATKLRGLPLWTAIVKSVQRLPLPVRDVGQGLVQAP